MKPLKIAFLWHQHQPYYKWDDEFILPWVRMHGVKDYYDLPCLIKDFPKIKQTFNFAPSLMIQIDEYISGKVKDKVQVLTEINAASLNDQDKKAILKQFFVCNLDNLIKPSERYYELYLKNEQSNSDINAFDTQDFLDLQVWYNLAWVGEVSKRDERITKLIAKDKYFNEEDKHYVLDYHLSVLAKISDIMNELARSGQIEISCSPEFHPILPIVIDSRSALEAMPWLDLSDVFYQYPEDAEAQINQGIDIYQKTFGDLPSGVWPSEGSLSDATCDMLAKANIQWVATDEQMLKETAKDDFFDTLKFFPQIYRNDRENLEIKLLFRDHFLSDRIGFVYSNWNAADAANEFCSHLDSIRNEIIRLHGEDALDFAVVTVILDGENCWEFYKHNGFPFLNSLFSNISENEAFITVKCSEAVQNINDKLSKTFDHIHSGSWINANFSIWIGHRDDLLAWKMLAKARSEVELRKALLPADTLREVLNEVYVAEGSDWFWWYGPEHNAPNKGDFDVLFRKHIARIYELLDLDVPLDVYSPLYLIDEYQRYRAASDKIIPDCNALITESEQWKGAAIFSNIGNMTAMHQIGEFLSKMFIGNTDDMLFIRFEFIRKMEQNEFILLSIDQDMNLKIFNNKIEVSNTLNNIELTKYAFSEVCDIRLKLFPQSNKYKFLINVKTNSLGNEIDYCKDFPINYFII